MTLILGLDLAERTGIAVLDGAGPKLRWSDSVRLANRDTGAGLLFLKDLMHQVLDRFKPAQVAIEDVFLPAKTSRRTPISLGELRGVARLCAAEADIPVFFYAPARIKMAITGNGRADKEAMVHLIEREFQVSVKDHNEADAISVAYTHWLTTRFPAATTTPR